MTYYENDDRNESNQPPNILFIMVDEMRYPVSYETDEIKKWRKTNLNAQRRLKREGIEFVNHYTGATACAPSRASIFTGHYPTLHGVSQTDGAGKTAHSVEMFWLDANTVPDMGDYFKKLDYMTLYKGKWHISEADIILPGTKNSLASYNQDGSPDPVNTEIYKNADRLHEFGFSGWIGPEPHGLNPLNSGASSSQNINGRDVIYVDEVVNLLNKLDKYSQSKSESKSKSKPKPWLMVASLVNPHDITLWGELTAKIPAFNFAIDPSVPDIPPAPTAEEDLSSKPKCQKSYKERYQVGFQPTIDNETYRQLYYSLNLTADRNVEKILDALDNSTFANNTIVVFTSDHGDYVGAHGLFQKWYTAYEEAIHVPLIVRLPKKMCKHSNMKGEKIKIVTSHLDLLPTLLGLVNADTERIQDLMKTTFTNVMPLVGRDLTPLFYGHKIKNEPQLFITDDNVLFGSNMVSFNGKPYLPVDQPASVQTIIAFLCKKCRSNKCPDSCKDKNLKLWKYSRYYDNSQFWSNPNVSNVTTIQSDELQLPGNNDVAISAVTTVTKTVPEQDEQELYCITNDPIEQYNLANPLYATDKTRKIQKYLASLLETQVSQKCLTPNTTV